jgi:hypothetical protein
LGPTGNSAFTPGCLAAALLSTGLDQLFDIDVVSPALCDALGDEALAVWLAARKPALLGFSLYMWNSERSLHIATRVKHRHPDTMVIIGGPEVQTDNAYLLNQSGFDIAVYGEGEETLGRLLRHLHRDPDPRTFPGNSLRQPGTWPVFVDEPPANFELNRFGSPYLLNLIPVCPDRVTFVETARGCNARCSFCFYSRGQHKVRRVTPDDVGPLLRRLCERGAQMFSILDPSFNKRPDFNAFLEALVKAHEEHPFSFFAEVKPEGLTDTQMDLLVQAGLRQVEVGLQSISRNTLRKVHRAGNPEATFRVGCELKKRGVEPLIDIVVGLPGDTRRDVIRGASAVHNAGLGAHLQLLPLSVLPGTALRRHATRDHIVFDPAPPYHVISTPTMQRAEIAGAIHEVEELIDRRMDEFPRPHLVLPDPALEPTDVIRLNLDEPEGTLMKTASVHGALHTALWLRGRDLFAARHWIQRLIAVRLQTDPYSTHDVVIEVSDYFPIDLIDVIRQALDRAPEHYMTRHLALRGENASRRICAVVPLTTRIAPAFIRELDQEIPVYTDMTLDRAITVGRKLGFSRSRARITCTPSIHDPRIQRLRRLADPEGVTFADRTVEHWWTLQVLGYAEAPP